MKKILVVEDDLILKENISLMLSTKYSVLDVNNGEEAINILMQNYEFDLIISDIMMPKIDGYELYKYVKNSEYLAGIPFIFLTARTEHSSVRKGMNLGVDDYITKPFKIEDLLNAVEARLLKKENMDNKFNTLKNSISQYVPHELRTPLVSILGNSEMISSCYDELSKSEILEMTDSINRSGKRLKRSIDKFLKYADLTIQMANGFEKDISHCFYSLNKYSCNSVLNTTYDCLNRMDDITFEIENAELKITEYDFETMIMELVTNACKFSEKKKAILVLGRLINNEYIITVHDKGLGITKENIKKIDSFVQFDRAYYQQDGNGIGLALVQLICKKYNVKFDIQSEIGKSTIVSLSFQIN